MLHAKEGKEVEFIFDFSAPVVDLREHTPPCYSKFLICTIKSFI